MAIKGVITDIGISKSIDAANAEGFFIVPVKFQVSDTAGVLETSRVAINPVQFFEAPISSAVKLDDDTVKFICTIPPGQIATGTTRNIAEISLIGDFLGEFLLALGQPNPVIVYEPSGSTTLELEVSVVNVDLSANIVFEFTHSAR